jgi:hypothetical protein
VDFVANWPPYRLLVFLAIAGVFFYRSLPRARWTSWRGRFRLLVYWLIVFFFYFWFAGIMGAGFAEVLKAYAKAGVDLEEQITITSLVLLFLYRLFSRYIPAHDESIDFVAEFLRNILIAYLAVSVLFYAFLAYLDLERVPQTELFKYSAWTYITYVLCVGADLSLWLHHTQRRVERMDA